nr:isoleucine--tRNA ligase [Gammaproteobacteria bacterium]
MADYKDTLNLPKTAFPMKANLAQREPEVLKHWQQINLYQSLREQGKDRPKFILHDGPPYANGSIHLGTTMNKVLKDIVTKSQTLSGLDAPYVPGWDCHGLPIELKVEKKVGKAGTKLNAMEFRQACREFAKKQVEIQKQDFMRLGVVGDWENPYLTMNPKYEANAVRALAEIVNNGHLMRGQKPVHWCTACASALAEAEVEYQDKTSKQIDVAFKVIDTQAMLQAFSCDKDIATVIVPIWTTTPWTLPANQAIAMHPELDYVLVQCKLDGDEVCLVVLKELLDAVMQRYSIENHTVLAESKGASFEHLKCQHPFLDRQVPIILGDHVTTDAGTGNVHTAPAHGADDYTVAQRYQLPVDNPVDSRSCFIDDVPFVGGQHVFKANDIVIETLKEKQALLSVGELQHSYPHCWRHKTPLIFRATPQWFISMDQKGLRNMALQAIPDCEWIPRAGETRLRTMIESRPDWCISRQRTWGIPITLFVHKATGELHPNTAYIMEQVADRVEKEGIDAWYACDAKDFIGDDADDYDKVTDVTDVWFESGVSHYCVLQQRPELQVPADLYLEGSDQHRGWFQSSLLSALAIRDAAPFKAVLTHGYVVDAKGHKMSKSVGNTILPADVVKKSGADILRLWAAACDHTGDVSASDEILKRSSDAYRRIRNTARFLLSNLYDFDPAKDQVANEQLVALDAWVIQYAQQLQKTVVENYHTYQFQKIYQIVHNFCSVDLGSYYLDIIKDRLYTAKANSQARRSAQTAMYHIMEALVRWMAPILSFTAEEIWRYMPGERKQSVFLDAWYQSFPEIEVHKKIDWELLKQVRDEVNKVLEARRQAGDIGSALETNVILYATPELYRQLKELADELHFMLITSGTEIYPMNEANGEAHETELAQVK